MRFQGFTQPCGLDRRQPMVGIMQQVGTVAEFFPKFRKHTRDVIKWLQGHETKTGTGYPQGGKLIRAEDHQAFAPIYIQQVVNGNWKVRATVPREKGFYKAQGNWKI